MFINEHPTQWKSYERKCVVRRLVRPYMQLTMEYNERDVSDDAQIVEDDEHDESEDEEDDEAEEEEDEEPEGGEDEEKNPWVGIREQVKERKEKLEALITEFQKIGDLEEVAAVKA